MESGLAQEEFDAWWERLELLSIKIGVCERKLNEYEDDILSEDTRKYGFFTASKEIGYVFERFNIESLSNLYIQVSEVAKNLSAYVIDLRDLSRPYLVFDFLFTKTKLSEFIDFCELCFNSKEWNSIMMLRLLPLESAKAAIEVTDKEYSYDKIANESGNEDLIRNPFTMRFVAGKKNNIKNQSAQDGLTSIGKRFINLGKGFWNIHQKEVLQQFIYNRFDGMVKQPKGSVLDALLHEEIKSFAGKMHGQLTHATINGIPSVFNIFVGSDLSGVNVEIPYVLLLPDKRKIFIHRVMSDGGMGHKRKEFSSKIRTIRYQKTKSGIIPRKNYFCSILIVDGNWITPKFEDPFMPIRMLTVAGWDYVVYPDGLSTAFAQIQNRLASEKESPSFLIPAEEPLPLAAETTTPIRIKKGSKKQGVRKRKIK